jgi:methylated-DNA-protein-cysteine methyltransferase-like protein
MTYGQIAAHCGNARAARIVGGIAHYGDTKVPWQRVVNRNGGLASGFPGGRQGHAEVLRQEGIEISKEFYILDFQEKLWQPQ